LSIYDGVESCLLRRGETLFPFTCFGTPRDWDAIRRVMMLIPLDGERVMTRDEILLMYDEDSGRI